MSHHPVRPRRLARITGTAGAACLLALPLALAPAAPAAAQQGPVREVAGGATGTALRLTLNLPGGEATRVVLELDPVTGTVSRTTSGPLAATASATVLRGSLGGQSLDTGTDTATLPEPTESETNPAGALAEGLAGTPLANLLKVELLPSSATVTADPSGTSTAAVANLGAGLPDALADALAPLLGPLAGGVDALLTTLAEESGTPVAEICAGVTDAVMALDPATGPIDEALGALPIPVPVQAILDETAIGAVCGLSTTLSELNTALQDALASLTGDSGVLGTGLITATQSQTTDPAGVLTSSASASIAGLTLLGQTPFANAQVLRTTSTAVAGGVPGSAAATVDSTIADLQGGSIDPFLQVRTTINGIRDSFVGEGTLPAALETVFDDLFSTLNAALAPVGITLFKLDDSADAQRIEGCPTELAPTLSGLLAADDGQCAAAATRGVGLRVDLPAALAGPLMVGGPLLELQIVPTAAVARSQPVAAPPVTPVQLPRTGGETALALAGLGVLGGALLLRRRSAAASSR